MSIALPLNQVLQPLLIETAIDHLFDLIPLFTSYNLRGWGGFIHLSVIRSGGTGMSLAI
jgi:hypothetical protein